MDSQEEIPGRMRSKARVRTVSTERMTYLWKRARHAARIIGRLSKMSKDIQLLGSSKFTYKEEAKRQSFTNSHTSINPQISQVSTSFHLSPKSYLFKFWSMIMLSTLLYTLTIVPYLVCFEDTLSPFLDYFNLCIDLLFCTDILINLCLAYTDNEGVFITDIGTISKHYLKTWFFIDLISSIPFQFIEQQYMKTNYNKLFRLLRLPRLYKLIKVVRMNRIARIFKKYRIVKKMLFILREHTGILNLIKFSFTVMILVHIMGCLWYFIAKYNDLSIDTWVFRHGYINSDQFTLYITSIYFIFTTLTTVGYGDIYPFTMEERVFTLIIMSFGVAFYSYTISNLSTIMTSIDSKSLNMKARISALNEFAKATKLPDELKQKIKSHILLNYEGNIFSWFDQDTLMNELPSSLRSEVSSHMHYKIVAKIHFFLDKDPAFISYMVPKLRTICLQAGDFLYKEHEYPDEVYFLTKGRVNLLAHNGKIFKTYVQGSYFGEVEILDNKTRSCTVQALKEGAEFLVISKRHFLKLMDEFPKIAEEIRETARLRNIKNSESKQAVLRENNGQKKSLDLKYQPTLRRIPQTEVEIASDNNLQEKNKSKKLSSIKEKHRKMWQELIHKEEEVKTSVVPQTALRTGSKWDSMMSTLFRKKTNIEKPVVSGSSLHEIGARKFRPPSLLINDKPMPPQLNSASKWNVLRGKYNEILEMSKQNKISPEFLSEVSAMNQPEKLDWLLDDVEINSPDLDTDDKSKSDPKLLLMRTLNNHLAQHNLRMQYKINVARKAFTLLKSRQDQIKVQIQALLTAAS